MATITRKKRKKGFVFRAEVRVTGHDRMSRTFELQPEAAGWAEKVEATLKGGGYVGNAPAGDMLFDDALRRYLLEVSCKKASSTHRREQYQARTLDYFNGMTLNEITPELAAEFRDFRLGSVQGATAIKDLNLLSHIFTVATREWGVKAVNPVAIIKKPTARASRLRFLSEGEAARLLTESKKSHRDSLYEYIVLQLYTGMRPSEGAGLTWGQVDLDKRVADLRETKTDPRRVPLAVPAVEVLAGVMPERCKCSDFVFLPENPKMTYRRRPNQYFRESFEAAVLRAGILDFHMHDLRHTAASYMIMSGVGLRTVADILGHKSISMTMKYTHLLDQYKTQAVDKIKGFGL